VIGLGGVENGWTASQSIIAILGSIALVFIELWVIFIGSLLS
jgi:hypothetical protein